MKANKASHLRIVKNDEPGKEEDLKQKLKEVHLDMERIIDLIDSNIELEDQFPPIAK